MINIETIESLNDATWFLLVISPSIKWDRLILVCTVCLAVITIVEFLYLISKCYPMTKRDKIWTVGYLLINTSMIAYNITIL